MKNTTTALLALIAVLLTLNLFRETSEAQEQHNNADLRNYILVEPAKPYVSAMAAESILPTSGAIQRTIYRCWSDGTTEKRSTTNGVWGDWFVMP